MMSKMQKLEPYMKSEEKVSTRYFECACHGLYHTLAITHFKASKAHTPDEMYICMLMDDRINFFKRLWKGLRFAFLRRPFYAEFAIEDRVQVSDIINTLEEFREFRELGESGDEKERVYKFRSPRIVK